MKKLRTRRPVRREEDRSQANLSPPRPSRSKARRTLVTLHGAALMVSAAGATDYTSPQIANNAPLTLSSGDTVTTTAGTTAQSALQASGVNGVLTAPGVTVNTSGDSASGAYANTNGRIVITGGSLTAIGANAHGARAVSGGTIDLSDPGRTLLVSTGTSGAGVYAQGGTVLLNGDEVRGNLYGVQVNQGGIVSITGGSVTATGGIGLYAQFGGNNRITATDVAVTSTGHGANVQPFSNGSGNTIVINGGSINAGGNGLYANNAQALIDLSDPRQTIVTAGSMGAYSLNGGTIRLNNDSITSVSHGLDAQNSPSLIEATNSTVTVQGSGHGALAQGGGIVRLDGVTLSTSGSAAGGTQGNGLYATGSGSRIEAASTAVSTVGQAAYGIRASSGGTVQGTGVTTTTTGQNAAGARAEAGSAIALTGSTVRTEGSGAAYGLHAVGAGATLNATSVNVTTVGSTASGESPHGAVAESGGAITVDGTSTISTSGAGAHAAVVRNGGTLSVSGGTLAATGANASGLFMTNAAGTTGTATLSDATLKAAQGPSITVDRGTANISFLNSTAVENNGVWLKVSNTDPANPAVANVFVDPSRLVGAAITDAGATSNVKLANGSLWKMTANSNITQLINDASVISFSPPPGIPGAGSTFKTLTVVNYTGALGVIGLNTHLGGDGSPSDRLVINGGTATGLTGLLIANAGGVGAVTGGNGIQVVDTVNGGTTAPGAFTLSQRVVEGPYEYQLFRSSVDASNPQGWYLRSERPVFPPPPPPPPPGPGEPPSPPPPPSPPLEAPLYRPEIGAYLSNVRQAGIMFLHSLHDRLGEPQWIETQDFDNQDDKRRSGWLRVVGRSGNSDSRDGNFAVDTNTTLIQGGGDFARWNLGGEHGRLHLGGMLGYGEASSDATTVGNIAHARGKTDGFSIGAYGTWYQNDENKLGWYTDVWGTYGAFKNTVNGDTLPEIRYDSRVLSLSGEAGYAMKIRQDADWIVEPQAQLVYLHFSEDDIYEPNGTRVNGDGGSGWISRLGVRVHRTWVGDDGKRMQPYLTLNWWHDSVDNTLAFNNVVLKDLYPDNRYEVKVGINADLRRGWTAWGNLGYQWGNQNFSATTVRVGAKYTW